MGKSSTKSPVCSRAGATLTVSAVFNGRSLDAELARHQAGLTAADQGFMQALAYGALRDWRVLQWLSRQMLDRPPRKSAALLEALLAVGLFQLRSMSQPERAVVHSCVEAARELRLDWASGLVNAVLRRYLREREALERDLPDDKALRYSHPNWLVKKLQSDWGSEAETLLAANQRPGPMWLRVNRQQQSRDAYLMKLQEAGTAARASAWAPDALMLEKPVGVQSLPGFAEGEVSVQDAAAQLAAPLLDCQDGQRVLDACAAPGGKTGHLLERSPGLELLALDMEEERLLRVEENLARIKQPAKIEAADASQPDAWWDGRAFDRILLDAPCSGTGVIRRHPDIKWLRRAEDIPALFARQLALLQAVWPTLAAGGRLLYATCSTLRAEGDDVIAAFLRTTADARIERIEAGWGEGTDFGRRIAAGQDDMDGFYYSLIMKRPAGIASDAVEQ